LLSDVMRQTNGRIALTTLALYCRSTCSQKAPQAGCDSGQAEQK
jgi:hypothetical protein